MFSTLKKISDELYNTAISVFSEEANESKEKIKATLPYTGKVIVVGLDILKLDNKLLFKQYSQLSWLHKLELIESAIKKLYKQILDEKPDTDKVIFAWRECGITEDAVLNSVSNEAKHEINKRLSKLTEKNDKLMIIAGSLLVRKEKPTSELQKVDDNYALHQENMFKESYNQLNQIKFHHEQLKQLMARKKTGSVFIFENITYIHANGLMEKHGKSFPFEELKTEMVHYPDSAFQLAKGRGDNSIVKIQNSPSCSIRICRDQLFFDNNQEIADLGFVLSDSIKINLNQLKNSEYPCFHLDSIFPTKMILPRNLKTHHLPLLYHYNLLIPNAKLEGPLSPYYPLQFKLLDVLDEKMTNSLEVLKETKLLKDYIELLTSIDEVNIGEYIKILTQINQLYYLVSHRAVTEQFSAHITLGHLLKAVYSIIIDEANKHLTAQELTLLSQTVDPSIYALKTTTEKNNLTNSHTFFQPVYLAANKEETNLQVLLVDAILEMNEETIHSLLDAGADPFKDTGDEGMTPYHVAKTMGCNEILDQYMASRKASI